MADVLETIKTLLHQPRPGQDGNYGYSHDPADQSRDDAARERQLLEACRDAATELATLRARLAQAETHLAELAQDAEDELRGHYDGMLDHPAMRRRFERDMAKVNEVRAFLAEQGEGKGGNVKTLTLHAREREDGSWFVTSADVPFYSYVTDSPFDWLDPVRLLADLLEKNAQPRKEVMPDADKPVEPSNIIEPLSHEAKQFWSDNGAHFYDDHGGRRIPAQPVEPPAGAVTVESLDEMQFGRVLHKRPTPPPDERGNVQVAATMLASQKKAGAGPLHLTIDPGVGNVVTINAPDYRAIACELTAALASTQNYISDQVIRNALIGKPEDEVTLTQFIDAALAAARAAGIGGE